MVSKIQNFSNLIKQPFFLNGSAASGVSAEVFHMEQKKTNFFIFCIKISQQIFENIVF